MPLVSEYRVGNVGVAVWKITETTEELLSLVAPEYMAAAALLRGEHRRREWLAVRALLGRVCGDAARIGYDSSGKPYLVGGGCHIGISHTRGYALLACSADNPFGVDAELLGRNAVASACKFMPASDVEALPHADADLAVLVRWSVCEALFKLVGDLGGTYKDNVVLHSSLPGRDGVIDVSIKGISGFEDACFRAFCIMDEDLLLVVCTPV